jgi:SNF family Na+-dependent transporter
VIENAALATVFALVAPFIVSWIRQAGWSAKVVQTSTYVVALVFAVVAVLIQGSFDPSHLDADAIVGYFAAILILAQALYVFLLKPSARNGSTTNFLARLNGALLGGAAPGPGTPPTGGETPPPGGG